MNEKSLKEEYEKIVEKIEKEGLKLAKTRERFGFFLGVAAGIIAGINIMAIVFSHLDTEPKIVDHYIGVSVDEYKQVVNSLDQCNRLERHQSETILSDEFNARYFSMLKGLTKRHYASDVIAADSDDLNILQADVICHECQEKLQQDLYACYEERSEACWCPLSEDDAFPYIDKNDLGYQELYDRVEEMCYAMESVQDPNGTLWSIVCPGVNGREQSEFYTVFEGFFGEGMDNDQKENVNKGKR